MRETRRLGPGRNVQSYTAAIMRNDAPHAFIGQRADGSMAGTIAYNVRQATENLTRDGADAASIRTADFNMLGALNMQELAERLIDESQTAHGCAMAEAREHYE